MPAENGYESRVAPIATAALPNASPESFGAGVGAGIAQFGNALARKEMSDNRIERKLKADQEAAAVAARFAAIRLENDKAVTDMRTNAAPGAAGHAETTEKMLAGQREAIATGITENSVRDSALARFDDYAGSVASGEYTFEVGARVGKAATDVHSATDMGANLLRTTKDPEAFARELKNGVQELQDMTGIPDDIRQKLIEEREQSYVLGHSNGMLDRGEARSLAAIIDSGAYNGILKPAQLEQLRSGTDVEIRRADAVTAQKNAVAEKALRDRIATAKTLNGAGAVQDDATLATLASESEAAGDHSTATELHVLRKENNVVKVGTAMTPVQRDQRIGALASLAKPSAEQQIELKVLRDHKGTWDSQYQSDRAGFLTANGQPPPPLTDPAARVRWARSTGAQPLTRNEIADYRERMVQSPAERLAVTNEIAALGGSAAFVAARQTGDATVARSVLLQPRDRAAAIDGQSARKANPAMIDTGSGGDAARDLFDKALGGSTGLWAQEDKAATFEIARNLYADWATKHGVSEFQPDQWNSFIHRAMAGTRDPQTHEWQGGLGSVNGSPVALPPGVSQSRFDKVTTYMNWSPKDPNAPVFANGTVMTPAQVRGFVPQQRPDGRYEFHGPNGSVLSTKGGGIWVLDVAKLAARAK